MEKMSISAVSPNKRNATKKKKQKLKPKRRKVRVLARPHQPLGTSFEYDGAQKALIISEFVSSESPVLKAGAVIGMHLTEVDDFNVVGLKQDDVVFMLQRKASSLRELLFEQISSTSSNVSIGSSSSPNLQTTNDVSRSQSAENNHRNTFDEAVQDEQEVSYTRSQLPQLAKPSPSSFTFGSSNDSFSGSRRAPGKQSSYVQSIRKRVDVSGSRAGLPQGSSNADDPFSTPARRRRLVADVARFLLKQYCLQACSLVHDFRVRNRSALIIQCKYRCWRAICMRLDLLHKKRSAAATQIQCHFRMVSAKSRLETLRQEYHKRLLAFLALRLQSFVRMKRDRKTAENVYRHKTALAIAGQKILRGKQGRMIASRRKEDLLKELNAKKRAAVRLQCRHRQRLANRVLLRLRSIFELKMSMSSRIARRWKSYCRKRHFAAGQVQRIARGWKGRMLAKRKRSAREAARLEQLRQNDERNLMGIEDDRASLLRAQHRVEIRVDLSPSLLSSLRRCKMSTLIKWCLEQSVLRFEDNGGSYAMGEVIRRVVHATSAEGSESKDPSLKHIELDDTAAQTSLDIKQAEDKGIVLPSESSLYPSQCSKRYTYNPTMKSYYDATLCKPSDAISHLQSSKASREKLPVEGRPLTVNICPRSGHVTMHLEPVFYSFAIESSRRHQQQVRRGVGACLGDPLSCPVLSACDVHIILGTLSSEATPVDSLHGGSLPARSARASGVGGISTDQNDNENEEEEEEMLQFRFRDVSVSVSVTSIVSGDDTTECLVNQRLKKAAELAEQEKRRAKELADLEATKALVAEINAMQEQAREQARLEEARKRQEEEEREARLQAEARQAAQSSRKSRPSTATRRVKVSVIDEAARREEELAKRLAEEAARQKRLEEERLKYERIRNQKLSELRKQMAARRVQRFMRECQRLRVQKKSLATLQGFFRRRRALLRWQDTAHAVVWSLRLVTLFMQKRYRGYRAREEVLLRRLAVSDTAELRDASHWVNQRILSDFRFALGRSFISEGKRGHLIGSDATSCAQDFIEEFVDEKDSGSSDGGDITESSSEDEGSEEDDEDDEDDYIINQRLNRHKVTPKDKAQMESFLAGFFSRLGAAGDAPRDAPVTSSVICCSPDELKSLGAPVSLEGGCKWAASIMHTLEFLPPPPQCIKPLDILMESSSSTEGEDTKGLSDEGDEEEEAIGNIAAFKPRALDGCNMSSICGLDDYLPSIYTATSTSST